MSKKEAVTISGEQTFKSGIKDMVVSALDQGGIATLNDCTITQENGTTVTFEIEVRVKQVKMPTGQPM